MSKFVSNNSVSKISVKITLDKKHDNLFNKTETFASNPFANSMAKKMANTFKSFNG